VGLPHTVRALLPLVSGLVFLALGIQGLWRGELLLSRYRWQRSEDPGIYWPATLVVIAVGLSGIVDSVLTWTRYW